VAFVVLAWVAAEVGDELGVEIKLGVDAAPSEMWDPERKRYVYPREGVERTREEQVEHILGLIERYALYTSRTLWKRRISRASQRLPRVRRR
jgi:enolase